MSVSACNLCWFILSVPVCSCGSASESSQTCLWSQCPPHPIQMLFHCFIIKGSETWEKKLRPWFSTTAREFCDLPHFVPGVTIFNPLILFFSLIAQCIFVLWFSRPSSCFRLFQKTELMSRVCHPLMSSVFPATVDFVVGFCVYTAIVSFSFLLFFNKFHEFLERLHASKLCHYWCYSCINISTD